MWWLISFVHGDFLPEHSPNNQEGWTPCIHLIHDFTSCFLFSIETQHTIGYGGRETTEECPEAIFLMGFQFSFGVMLEGYAGGVVVGKFCRARRRNNTLLFSTNALVCKRNGEICLMFRIGDLGKSHITEAGVRAVLIKTRTTKEGETLNYYQRELTISADDCGGDLFFIWPLTVVHKIDEDSPFYNMSPSEMQDGNFEIIVILEGTEESTGQTIQARTSYLSTEILWGFRFEPTVHYSKDLRGYEVDYSKFDAMVTMETPLCSAAEWEEYCKQKEKEKDGKFKQGQC